ncbi:erythromycin esterase family protein [Micromonospora sp. LZ34]
MTAFTGRLADHVTVLATLDPDAPLLDELNTLHAVAQDARVLAIGEGAHFVHEFMLGRARLLRYLVERCGFTVVALEMGAADAEAINPWLAGGEGDLDHVAGLHTRNLFGELLHWLRRYNRGRSQPIEIIGIDLPNALTCGRSSTRSPTTCGSSTRGSPTRWRASSGRPPRSPAVRPPPPPRSGDASTRPPRMP